MIGKYRAALQRDELVGLVGVTHSGLVDRCSLSLVAVDRLISDAAASKARPPPFDKVIEHRTRRAASVLTNTPLQARQPPATDYPLQLGPSSQLI